MDWMEVLADFIVISIPQVFVFLVLALQLYGKYETVGWRRVAGVGTLIAAIGTLFWEIGIPFGFQEIAKLSAGIGIVRWLLLPSWKEASLTMLLLYGMGTLVEGVGIWFAHTQLGIDIFQFPAKIIFAWIEIALMGLTTGIAVHSNFKLAYLKNDQAAIPIAIAMIMVIVANIFLIYPIPLEGYVKSKWLEILADFAVISIPQIYIFLTLTLQLHGKRQGISFQQITRASIFMAAVVATFWGIEIPYGFQEIAKILASIGIVHWILFSSWKDSAITTLLFYTVGISAEALSIYVSSTVMNIDILQFPTKIFFAWAEFAVFGLLTHLVIKYNFEISSLKNNKETRKTAFLLMLILASSLFFVYPIEMNGYVKSKWLEYVAHACLPLSVAFLIFDKWKMYRKRKEHQLKFIFDHVIMNVDDDIPFDGGTDNLNPLLAEKLIVGFLWSWKSGFQEIPLRVQQWAKHDELKYNELFYHFWFCVREGNPRAFRFLCNWIKQNGVILRREWGVNRKTNVTIVAVFDPLTGDVLSTTEKPLQTSCERGESGCCSES